jgi:Nitrogen regulatory protein P-II
VIKMTERERIEVLVDAPLAPQLARLALQAGITGHTLIRTDSGQGHSGEWSEDLISGATAKYLFLTVANSESATRFLDSLEPLLESHGLVVLRSIVDVIRPERF